MAILNFPKRKIRKLIDQGDYREALDLGKQIESKHSNDPDFFFIMGSTYYILEDAKNSIGYFDKVLKLRPDDIEALMLKANVHFFLKETDQVIECCNRILKNEPNHKGANELMDKLAKD